MVLNSSIRNLLLDLNERNNYVNNLISITGTISELLSVETMYKSNIDKIQTKTIELKSKSKSKSKKSEILVDKLTEELSDEDDDEEDNKVEESDNKVEESDNKVKESEKRLSDIKNKNEDLKVPQLNDIVYINPKIKDNNLLISRFIDDSTPKDEFIDLNIDLDEGIDEDIVLDVKEEEEEKEKEKEEKEKEKPIKSDNDDLDKLLFKSLEKLHNKPSLTQSKISDKPNEASGGGFSSVNVKKIKLTEKYDFF